MRSYERRVRMGFNTMLLPISMAALILMVALLHGAAAQGQMADELESELKVVSELRTDMAHAETLVHEYEATGDRAYLLEYQELARSTQRNLDLVGNFDEPDEVQVGEEARAAWDAGQRDAALVFAAPVDSAPASAHSADEHFATAEAHVTALDEFTRVDLRDTAAASATTSRRVVALALLIGICATAMNVALVQRLLRATFTPLRLLIESASRFSAGDLRHRVEPLVDREFQAVGQSFNAMADHLEDTFASLEHQAFHDSLTGLPSRPGLLRHLQTQDSADRALLLFDLDDFKAVNDGLGHGAGDEALVQVAQRFVGAVRDGDFLARLGGDEFVVVLDGLPVTEAVARGEAIAEEISRPYDLGGRSVVLHSSTGIASVRPGDDPTDALRTADIALYVAKAAGKQCVRLFDPDMLRDVEARLRLETDLRTALDRGEISVHYQPTVSISTGTVQGVEALIRWTHPERGAVSPVTFIPIAEENGQIHALGRFVLNAACQQAKAWQQLPGLGHLSMNVNVSASQLQTTDIVSDVARALETTRLAAGSLTIEVTESVMANPEVVARVHEIKALGVRIALDDFGTGYSSLSYLQRLPIDVLKIDKSFIDDIDRRADRAVLANTIVRLGRSLGLVTVAEGVERIEQFRTLESVGCELVQGYLFARPQPPNQIEARLLELTASAAAAPAYPPNQWVRVTVGPLDVAAARDWLQHAHWALDELESGRLLPGELSTAVIALMRGFVDRWTIAAMESHTFIWVANEDPDLLGLMMSRWHQVSAALVHAAANGTFVISAEAAAFSETLVHSLLAAVAARPDEGTLAPAAVLAQSWPNQLDNDRTVSGAS